MVVVCEKELVFLSILRIIINVGYNLRKRKGVCDEHSAEHEYL